MRYALINGEKTEALKGAKGTCPICGSELIPKCGEVKVHHWAHKEERNCDPWWEPETEWHRSWKNNFAIEWQENILTDERTGEKHIADVRTIHGLVIEFQHSHIDQQERTSRENFYKNMVWVVDGARLKEDYHRFVKGKKYILNAHKPDYFLVGYPELCFPSDWLKSSVPVIFDFRGIEAINELDDPRIHLYCLFPKADKKVVSFAKLSRESFINNTINGVWFKKQQEPQKQSVKPPIKNKIVKRRESPLIWERGRWRKRHPRL
jgi:hypothetical protein